LGIDDRLLTVELEVLWQFRDARWAVTQDRGHLSPQQRRCVRESVGDGELGVVGYVEYHLLALCPKVKPIRQRIDANLIATPGSDSPRGGSESDGLLIEVDQYVESRPWFAGHTQRPIEGRHGTPYHISRSNILFGIDGFRRIDVAGVPIEELLE
jgi:hypothetical protein